jgi:hypothetical protein
MAGAASKALFRKVKSMQSRKGSQKSLTGSSSKKSLTSSTSRKSLARASAAEAPKPERRNSFSEVSEEAPKPEVGFHRLVYKKARSLHEERKGSNRSFREVASDVKHAVKVCLLLRHFLELLRLGEVRSKLLEDGTCYVIRRSKGESSEDAANREWQALMTELSPMSPAVTAWTLAAPGGNQDTSFVRSRNHAVIKEHISRSKSRPCSRTDTV